MWPRQTSKWITSPRRGLYSTPNVLHEGATPVVDSDDAEAHGRQSWHRARGQAPVVFVVVTVEKVMQEHTEVGLYLRDRRGQLSKG